MEITFSCEDKVIEETFPVFPSSANIPKWYANVPLEANREKRIFKDGTFNSTIKRCVPFIEAITAGYVIPLPFDIFVTRVVAEDENGNKEDLPYYSSHGPGVSFHNSDQAKDYPLNKSNKPLAKINNPWYIKTPPGYSCLFVSPLNNKETPIEVMSGIVDTDKYLAQINFPFTLVDEKFEGLIAAGTPIVQVIPFKRESWKMKIGNISDINESKKTAAKLKMLVFDSYRSQFWEKKEFR